MKKILSLCIFFCAITLSAQDKCSIQSSKTKDVPAVDAKDLACMAKNSKQKYTLFFTFGVWCEPCRIHLPGAIKLAKEHDVELYIVLLEKEDDKYVPQAVEYLKKIDKDIKVLVVKDATYGTKRSAKNKKFVTEITPSNFENIDDYSKFILYNKEGKVIMITNWKDYNDNWKDEESMIKRKILPLL